MSPTGILRRTSGGIDLELTRTFGAPRDDVWASLTESDRTAAWYGPWENVADGVVRIKMVHEDGQPWSKMNVVACEAPSHLALTATDEDGWQLEAHLTEADGVTTVTFVHHLTGMDGIGDIGPGWEYYLDMLVASRDGRPLPSFDDYFPAQQNYYSSLTPE